MVFMVCIVGICGFPVPKILCKGLVSWVCAQWKDSRTSLIFMLRKVFGGLSQERSRVKRAAELENRRDWCYRWDSCELSCITQSVLPQSYHLIYLGCQADIILIWTKIMLHCHRHEDDALDCPYINIGRQKLEIYISNADNCRSLGQIACWQNPRYSHQQGEIVKSPTVYHMNNDLALSGIGVFYLFMTDHDVSWVILIAGVQTTWMMGAGHFGRTWKGTWIEGA